MAEYLDLKEYSKRIGRSLASVYRDAEKGLIKIALIKGKKHVILDEEEFSQQIKNNFENDEKNENADFEKTEKVDNEFQDAEIIDESPSLRFELDIFKSSITTMEDLASRIEAAKNETIRNLKDENEKKEKTIENLNEIIKTLSGDNQELRMQVAIRDTEKKIDEKRLEELNSKVIENDKMLSQYLVEINTLKAKKAELLSEIDKLKDSFNIFDHKYKSLEEQINTQKIENFAASKSLWHKL